MQTTWIKRLLPLLFAALPAVTGCSEAAGPIDLEEEQVASDAQAQSIIAGYDLTNAPATVGVGQGVTASFVAPAGHGTTDWVGIYAVGAQASQYLTWTYAADTETGTVALTLPGSAVVGTSYELRLYLDNGYTLAAVSTPFIATDPVIAYGLDGEPAYPAPGTSFPISWTAPASHATTDWIGLFLTGAANNEITSFVYVDSPGATSGAVSLQLPASAAVGSTYEVRYFLNNTYDRAATSDVFTVGNTLTAPPGPIAAGASISTTWVAPPAHATTDWIGLFEVGAPNNQIASFAYVGAAGQGTGSLSLTVPASAPDGQAYELRYFLNNTYVLAGRSTSFEVGQAYSLVGPTATQAPGTSISASWTAPTNHATTDWIGLFQVGSAPNAIVTYTYVGAAGQASGTTNLTIPASAALGSYELRYHTNNTYNVVATSDPFEVGIPEAELLVTGIPTVANLVSDGTALFFTSGGHRPAYGDGSVQSIPLAGGTPTVLVSGLPTVEGIALAGDQVLFTSIGAPSAFVTGLLGSAPKTGGSYTTIASALKYCLWVQNAGGHYYFVNSGSLAASFTDGSIGVSIGGAAPTVIADEINPLGVFVDATHVYWSSGGTMATSFADGALRRMPVAGGPIETLATDVLEMGSLIVAGNRVYFGMRDAVGVVDPAAPGVVTTFASQAGDPGRFATDGTNLYWTEPSGRVLRKAIAGGPTVVLAEGINQPFGITLDGAYVYFTVRGSGLDDGGIMRVTK